MLRTIVSGNLSSESRCLRKLMSDVRNEWSIHVFGAQQPCPTEPHIEHSCFLPLRSSSARLSGDRLSSLFVWNLGNLEQMPIHPPGGGGGGGVHGRRLCLLLQRAKEAQTLASWFESVFFSSTWVRQWNQIRPLFCCWNPISSIRVMNNVI